MDMDKLSKNFCYILRHNPSHIGITLDSEGYVDLDLFIQGYNDVNKTAINKEIIELIVKEDNKARYTIDNNKIRCNQGHNKSLDVDVSMQICKPPILLYHGTGRQYVDSIMSSRIESMSRKYVHLSDDKETAIQVAKRHSHDFVILKIDAEQMYLDGFEFRISDNGVWQVDSVPSKYISK